MPIRTDQTIIFVQRQTTLSWRAELAKGATIFSPADDSADRGQVFATQCRLIPRSGGTWRFDRSAIAAEPRGRFLRGDSGVTTDPHKETNEQKLAASAVGRANRGMAVFPGKGKKPFSCTRFLRCDTRRSDDSRLVETVARRRTSVFRRAQHSSQTVASCVASRAPDCARESTTRTK
jgi:hypothetical protein